MIEVKSRISADETKLLQKASMKKLIIIVSIFSALFILLAVVEIITEKKFTDYAVYMLSFGIIFPIIYIGLMVLINKKMQKSNKLIGDDTVNAYKFEDDKFSVVTTRGGEYTGESVLKYSDLYQIVENKDCFFLYINMANVLIIAKKYMQQEEITQLAAFLKSKMNPLKYKNK